MDGKRKGGGPSSGWCWHHRTKLFPKALLRKMANQSTCNSCHLSNLVLEAAAWSRDHPSELRMEGIPFLIPTGDQSFQIHRKDVPGLLARHSCYTPWNLNRCVPLFFGGLCGFKPSPRSPRNRRLRGRGSRAPKHLSLVL